MERRCFHHLRTVIMNLVYNGGYRSVHAGQQELSHDIRGMLYMQAWPLARHETTFRRPWDAAALDPKIVFYLSEDLVNSTANPPGFSHANNQISAILRKTCPMSVKLKGTLHQLFVTSFN